MKKSELYSLVKKHTYAPDSCCFKLIKELEDAGLIKMSDKDGMYKKHANDQNARKPARF